MKEHNVIALVVSVKRLFAWLSLGLVLAIFLGSFDSYIIDLARNAYQIFAPFVLIAGVLLPAPFVYLWWIWR